MKEALRSLQSSVRDSTTKVRTTITPRVKPLLCCSPLTQLLYILNDESRTVDEKFETERSTFKRLKVLLESVRAQAEKQQYMTESTPSLILLDLLLISF